MAMKQRETTLAELRSNAISALIMLAVVWLGAAVVMVLK